MTKMNLVHKAFEEAAELHKDQIRKGGKLFIVHLFGVYKIVEKYEPNDEIIQSAALLHDAIKYVCNYEFLAEQISPEVATIVRELGEAPGEKEDWKERKYASLKKFPKMSVRAQKVFVADKINNLRSLIEDYKVSNIKVWEKFNANEKKIARYYYDVYIKLTTYFHYAMIKEYHETFIEAVDLFVWKTPPKRS